MKKLHDSILLSPTAIHYLSLASNENISGITSLAGKTLLSAPAPLPHPYRGLIDDEAQHWLAQESIPVSRLALARQVHGATVRRVSRAGIYADTDGFFTDRPQLSLAIRTADCAAVLLSFPQVPAIGIAHAGWRGARVNIVGRLLEEMFRHWPVDPASVQAALSPHIKACCYQVGAEFGEFFPAEVLYRRGEMLYFDLEKTLLNQLAQQQIPAENITVAPFCTVCAPIPLHSYRRDKTTQRLFNLITIEKAQRA